MAVYDPRLTKLRKNITDRKKVIQSAVTKLNKRIKEGEANPSSAAGRNLPANRANLLHAVRILGSFDAAIAALQVPCCQNDLNCEIETG